MAMTPQEALAQLRTDIIDWVTKNLKLKVDVSEGQSLSANDFTNELKDKLENISESADSVSFTPAKTEGSKIGTININGEDTDMYADAVSFTPAKTEGSKIGTININGENTDMYADAVSFTPAKTEGSKIGTININGENTDMFADAVKYTSAIDNGTKIGTININGEDKDVLIPEYSKLNVVYHEDRRILEIIW